MLRISHEVVKGNSTRLTQPLTKQSVVHDAVDISIVDDAKLGDQIRIKALGTNYNATG
jgi:hypothetical protein